MEKNIIISKIAEKEVYNITKCVSTGDDTCSLFLFNHTGKFIGKNLPRKKVQSAIKKYNLFWRWIYGFEYQSVYVLEKIPYYDDKGWKSFTWREYLDEKELSCNNDFPEALSISLQNLEADYLKFVAMIKDNLAEYKKQLSIKARLSSVMEIYWAEILCRQNKHRQILDMIYPLLLRISLDKKAEANVNALQSMAKYLYMSQQLGAVNISELAKAYVDNMYTYLLSSYQLDIEVLQDIYDGEENIGKQDSILEYENYLYFFDAINLVIECLDVR